MKSTGVLTICDAIHQIRAGQLDEGAPWNACTNQIERLNPRLNAFITRIEKREQTDSRVVRGMHPHIPSLAGIPIAVKDLFNTEGVLTTAGSLFFRDHVPDRDATAVAKIRAAGAQIIGKTNTHEIALGVTTVNPHFGACRNPWDPERVPGGSSGGSAVAVATGMALGALGTDTGGSIRIPASLCGVVGLKPTYGRVSLRGVFPLSWNLDHAGPLTRSVADAALLLQVIAGYDEDDPHCADVPVGEYALHLEDGVRGWRLVLASGAYVDDSDREVIEAVLQAARVFRKVGATVRRVDLSYLREAALANGMMTQADAAAFHRERLAEHPDLFGQDVRRRLEAGRDLPSADYSLARRTQAEMRRRLEILLKEFQIILLPTTATTAPKIEGGEAVEHARRLTRYTAPFNLAGLPAISVPCGFSRDGLPIGLQLVAAAWNEAGLLQAARAYEREAGWGSRLPEGVG